MIPLVTSASAGADGAHHLARLMILACIPKTLLLFVRDLALFQRQTMNRFIVDADDLVGDCRIGFGGVETQ